MKRIIGYIRVSTSNQDLERQKMLIKNYCVNNGFALVRIEQDFAISGADPDRDGLNRILSLTKNDADMVVVSELSRISRQNDIMNTLSQIHNIINKMDLVMLDDPNKIYKAGIELPMNDFLMLAIKAYGAADERKKIGTRMKEGKYSKITQFPMMVTDSRISLGFDAVPNPDYISGKTPKAMMVVNEKEMDIVRSIFQYILDGYSIRQTAAKLNKLNIKSKEGNAFQTSSLNHILHNIIYNGRRIFKGIEVKLPITIISDENWSKTRIAIENNKKYNHEAQIHYNPLKGIAKCVCGSNMTVCMIHNEPSLKCLDRATFGSISRCTSVGCRLDTYVEAVWKTVRWQMLDKEYQAKSNDAVTKIEIENVKLEDSISQKDQELKAKKEELDNVINIISVSTNSTVIMALNSKVDGIEKEIKQITKDKESINKEIASNLKRIEDERKSLAVTELDEITPEGKAEIFKRVLNKVVYYNSTLKTGFYVIDYKNGGRSIVALDNRRNKHLYLVASNKFNPETRKVIVDVTPKGDKFSLQTKEEEWGVLDFINPENELLTI